MKLVVNLLFASLGLVTSGLVNAGDAPHWGYDGQAGPENWARLTPEYVLCGTGMNQSPIDIAGEIKAELPPIEFSYTASATEILNNGHTVQANFAPGSTIRVGGRQFELKQVHFHTPSENNIRGKSFPMEAHLVHADSDGRLAVVAVMFTQGKDNPAVAKLFDQLPENVGDKLALDATLKAAQLLPRNRGYYRFSGSLTTPPCTEGVTWLVMKDPVTVGAEQVGRFAHAIHHANNRPLQTINARAVLH